MVDVVEETAATTDSVATRPPRSPFALLAVRDFRLLWLGESISLLGDQFYLIALPWLTLQLTGSGLALGTVMMAAGVPRVVFMLVGGAIVDRLSPRPVMLASNLLRFTLTAVLTALVFFHSLQLWMLYVIAFGFGLVDAFFHPAYLAMMPRLIETHQLEAGNAVMQGTGQIMQFVGAAPAGVIITALGTGAAFGFDALTFLVAALMVQLIRGGGQGAAAVSAPSATALGPRAVLASIIEGIRFVRKDPALPTIMMMFAGVNVFLLGPIDVGIPILIRARFAGEGAAGVGTIFSVLGGGSLLGALLGGTLPTWRFGILMVALEGMVSAALALIGVAPSFLMVIGLAGLIGLGVGYVSVLGMARLQRMVPPEAIGRFMGLFMMVTLGLVPISNAVAGAAADLNLTLTFVLGGGAAVLVCLWAITKPVIRALT